MELTPRLSKGWSDINIGVHEFISKDFNLYTAGFKQDKKYSKY